MNAVLANVLAVIFCAAGMGLCLFSLIVARTELEQRRAGAARGKRRNRRGRPRAAPQGRDTNTATEHDK
jgi:hypothetical protein